MKYYLSVAGREREVEILDRAGELHVLLDGVRVDADYVEVDRLGQVALRLGSRTYAVSVEGRGTELGVTVAGHFFEVRIEDERERAAHAADEGRANAGGVLNALMPGVVVELLVKVGDEVELGQPLLILEAMKMQNELRARGPGLVESLHVARGEAVPAGARLVTLRVR